MQWSYNNSPLVGHHNYPLVVQNGGMGLHLQVVHGQAYISVSFLYKPKLTFTVTNLSQPLVGHTYGQWYLSRQGW